MNSRIPIGLLLLLGSVAPGWTQVTQLTPETIYGSNDFRPTTIRLSWMNDGEHYTTVERDGEGHTDLYRVRIRSGERERLVRGADLVEADGSDPIAIDAYAFSDGGSKLLIATDVSRIWRRSTRARYYVWDFETRELTPVSKNPGYQRYAKFSPDAGHVAFVRDHDIYVTHLASGEERALTADGGPDIVNGATDWVYEEELSLADGFRWSPDGTSIAFWRFDQSPIPPFYLLDQTQLYPALQPVRYPKAGTDNSRVRLGVVRVADGATTWIEPAATDGNHYLARMGFAGSPHEIWFIRLNRFQNRLELRLADTRTGESRVVMTDRDDAWIDIDFNDLTWIDDGDRFVYLSERSGYGQLYLYQRDGSRFDTLTSKDLAVLDLYGVDEERDRVYFTAAADGPRVRPLYRVDLTGGGLRRVSDARGTHRVSFDPTYSYYLDTYSEAGVPPTQTLRTADGERVRTLVDNADVSGRLAELGLVRPEFLTVPAADGTTELNAWLIKPPTFDPAERYPLLVYVYGGPGSQTVTDSWGGDRYLWHQSLALKGYLVASVDNRGTGARGAAFKKITYLNLGHYESADQIAGARHFARLPYVDPDRIGIWGWSYGGYMAALASFTGGDVFKAAISVAPVTDWRLYDTIYTERYMRTPETNPRGYEASAPLAYADRLSGAFLLVHGTGDDNVHHQNSMQLVQRLEEANKQFRFRLYPNKAHGIGGSTSRINLYELMTRFILENL